MQNHYVAYVYENLGNTTPAVYAMDNLTKLSAWTRNLVASLYADAAHGHIVEKGKRIRAWRNVGGRSVTVTP